MYSGKRLGLRDKRGVSPRMTHCDSLGIHLGGMGAHGVACHKSSKIYDTTLSKKTCWCYPPTKGKTKHQRSNQTSSPLDARNMLIGPSHEVSHHCFLPSLQTNAPSGLQEQLVGASLAVEALHDNHTHCTRKHDFLPVWELTFFWRKYRQLHDHHRKKREGFSLGIELGDIPPMYPDDPLSVSKAVYAEAVEPPAGFQGYRQSAVEKLLGYSARHVKTPPPALVPH